jgi:hypothetical protein
MCLNLGSLILTNKIKYKIIIDLHEKDNMLKNNNLRYY